MRMSRDLDCVDSDECLVKRAARAGSSRGRVDKGGQDQELGAVE